MKNERQIEKRVGYNNNKATTMTKNKKGQYTKGNIPHNKGKTGYKNKGSFLRGKLHPGWLDKPGYSGIHKWIVRNYGKADRCYFCEERDKKVYDWANVSGEYGREITDWIQLCRGCHIKFDRIKKVKNG